MKFRLSKQTPGETITKFFVYNSSGDTIGIISVPNEEADDLERHWLGGGATQPQASAVTKKGTGLLAAALEANKRPGALPPDRAKQENPMVSAMLRAAKQHTLNRQAILRSC
jgi:hypothetical protein